MNAEAAYDLQQRTEIYGLYQAKWSDAQIAVRMHIPAAQVRHQIEAATQSRLTKVGIGSVLERGMQITSDADEADVLVVNTCAFIDSAKEESIEAIFEAHQQRAFGKRPNVTFIEPYPALLESLLRAGDHERVRIVPSPVQDVPATVFDALDAGDVLFIDSTHVLKTGSDVAHELSQVLPRLKRGVVIHFHDMFYPFEYPYGWVVTENRSWNELYAMRSFLAYNDSFEVLFFNDMFAQLRGGLLEQTCPAFVKNSGGSLWLRRVA